MVCKRAEYIYIHSYIYIYNYSYSYSRVSKLIHSHILKKEYI